MSCPSGKLKYKDELEAKMSLALTPLDDATFYDCKRCNGWHITTKNRQLAQSTPGSKQRRYERRQKVRRVA